MQHEIKTIEIEIENPYTGETDTINCGTRENMNTIITHLNSEYIIKVETVEGYELKFSGMNATAELSCALDDETNSDYEAFYTNS